MGRRFLLIFTVFGLLAGCDIHFDGDGWDGKKEEEPFQFSYDFKPGDKLVVDNYNGTVEIEGWEQAKIDVSGVKWARSKEELKDVKVEAKRGEGRVDIRTEPPPVRRGSSGARYTIKLPRQAVLELIKSSNGSIRVNSLEGPVRLRTSNGAIRVADVKGDVTGETSNGAVEAVRVTGGMRVVTSNGRVKLEGVNGAVDADTSNGSINAEILDNPMRRTSRFSSTNGAVDVRAPKGLNADLKISTTNGSVRLTLPANFSGQLSARTSNASVDSDFDVKGEVEKKRVEGRIGAGGPLVDLRTSNGGISVRKAL